MATKNDEDKMKQRGLDASNKEKPVSFFQRLKMGNIDDPKSEAYKKFGAGRGRKDRDDADFAAEEARGKTARSQSGKAPATSRPTRPGQQVSGVKPAAKAKPAIVTKEELAKSGLSLRDYMNKQQGKTRRGGKAPDAAKPATTTSKLAGAPGLLDPQQKAQQKNQGPYRNEGRNTPAPAEKPKTAATSAVASKQREADEKRREERREFGRQRDAEEKAQKEKFTTNLSSDPKQQELKADKEKKERMSPAERSAARGRSIKDFFSRPFTPAMAKGGSVSSASKRADGIAQSGKTRGKVY